MTATSPLSSDRIAEIRASQAIWGALAENYDERADVTEKMEAEHRICLFDSPAVRRTNAQTFRAVVSAYDLEIKTGKPHCSCCMKPLGDTRVLHWVRG